jgi:replicative DNA helicase
MNSIESNIIASLYVNSENLSQAIEFGMTGEWFRDCSHGAIFSELQKLLAKSTWNPNTSSNVMISNGVFDRHPQLLEVCTDIPEWAFSLDDLQDAFEVLRCNHGIDRIRKASLKISTMATEGEDPFEIASLIIAELEDMENIGHSEERTTKAIAKDLIKLDKKIVSGEKIGLPFPWEDIQRATYGIPFSAVTPLAGRDGKGKSRLATYLGVQWASEGYGGLIFPFEDTELRCMRNASANLSEYDAFNVNNEHVSPKFLENHYESINRTAKLPFYICDYAHKIERIISQIATHKRKYDIKWVIIDGFKDVSSSGGENRTQEEVRMMRALTAAARKYKVAIIPVMHLNKVVDDKWISKQDITGSGDQTKSARMVMVYQDSVPDEIKQTVVDGFALENLFVLDIQKASYGHPTLKPLVKNLEQGRFDEVERT